jgi:DNA polymerase-3 subunit delta'
MDATRAETEIHGTARQIIGHEWAADLLRQSIAAGRAAHAYLLTGPPQVGKTRLALDLAQSLNCGETEPPCGRCRSCLRIREGVHPDVQVIVGTGAGGTIKIDQVRTLQRKAVLAPYEGRYRVFILRRMDRATTEAANSLLKTLEEPPAHVVLILTAVQPEALPATVVSRCQRLNLRPVPIQVVEEALCARGLGRPEANFLANLSGGRVGWAVDAVQDDAVLEQRKQELDQLVDLLAANRVERVDYAWGASRDMQALLQRIELWTLWWRDLLLLCGHNDSHVLNVDRIEELRSLVTQTTLSESLATLQALQRTSEQLEANVNARLALEGLLFKLPHWQIQRPAHMNKD